MPRYVIERQYLLPVYQQLLIEAPDLETACREALDEFAHPWGADAEQDVDNARRVTITEAVELPEAMHPKLRTKGEIGYPGLGELLYHSGLPALTIRNEFTDDAETEEAIGFS